MKENPMSTTTTLTPQSLNAVRNLEAAMARAMAIRPAVGGFPYLAETLRQAGITRNTWLLPSGESCYETTLGLVTSQPMPLAVAMDSVPAFDEAALIRALRTDQAGESTFPEFMLAAWYAGVVRYEVDFLERHVVYYGSQGESYLEAYPAVEL
jgi:uncharacterized protein YbcV (DUF1398 family)